MKTGFLNFLKARWLNILVIVVAVASVAVITGVVISNTPQNVAKNAILGAVNDLFEREEIAPIVNTVQKGSVEANMTELKENGKEVYDNFELSGKIYFSKKSIMVDDFLLKIDRTKIGGEAYFSADKIYVNETEYFDQSLGFVKGELADDFKESVFDYYSGSKYAITDKDTYDRIVKLLEHFDESDFDKMSSDAKKLGKKYLSKLWDIFCDYAEFEVSREKVNLQGEFLTVRTIKITLDGEAEANIIRDIYYFLKSDDDIIEFINKYEGDLYELAKGRDESVNSFAEYFEKAIKEMKSSVDNTCKELKNRDNKIEFKLTTPLFNSKLVYMTISVDEYQVFELDLGKNGMKKSNKITMKMGGATLGYEKRNNPDNTIDAVITVNGDDEFKFEYDKNSEEFKLNLSNDTEINGFLFKSGGQTTIVLDTIAIYRTNSLGVRIVKSIYETDLQLIIKQKDRMPKPEKNFTRLDELDDDKIRKFITKAGSIF